MVLRCALLAPVVTVTAQLSHAGPSLPTRFRSLSSVFGFISVAGQTVCSARIVPAMSVFTTSASGA